MEAGAVGERREAGGQRPAATVPAAAATGFQNKQTKQCCRIFPGRQQGSGRRDSWQHRVCRWPSGGERWGRRMLKREECTPNVWARVCEFGQARTEQRPRSAAAAWAPRRRHRAVRWTAPGIRARCAATGTCMKRRQQFSSHAHARARTPAQQTHRAATAAQHRTARHDTHQADVLPVLARTLHDFPQVGQLQCVVRGLQEKKGGGFYGGESAVDSRLSTRKRMAGHAHAHGNKHAHTPCKANTRSVPHTLTRAHALTHKRTHTRTAQRDLP
jgi:hypothetical protein